MSSNSYESICPNCEKKMMSCTESRPFEYTIHSCLYCGFFTTIKAGYMTLEELNSDRENMGENLRKLKKLPKQNFEF